MKCSYGWPVRCDRDAALEVYDFRKREAVPACAAHAGSVVMDTGRACMVKPVRAIANRNPNDRRERSA